MRKFDLLKPKGRQMAHCETPWSFGGPAYPDTSQRSASAMFERAMLLELPDGKEPDRIEFERLHDDPCLGISVCSKAAW